MDEKPTYEELEKEALKLKQAELSLQESEERYALAQKVANVGSWDWNIQTGDLHWSEQIEPMFGFENGKFGATYKAFLECVHPEDRQIVIDSVNVCIEKQKDYAIEHRIVWPDGTVRWVSETGNVFRDVKGKAIRMMGIVQDITDRKRAENERQAYIHFLESLERIDQAIHQADNMEQMLWDVVETMFLIFGCDRAWLLHPCNPEAPSFRVPVEFNRPGYPGACALDLEAPIAPGQAQDMRDALSAMDPVCYTNGTERPVCEETNRQFGVQAQIFLAVYPKMGEPWMLGMHQCSYPRIWTNEEQQLFNEIGRRVADGLSSMLFLRDLQQGEGKFRRIFESIEEGYILADLDGKILSVNPAAVRILKYKDASELIDKNIGLQIYADGSQRKELLEQLKKDGIVTGFEIEFKQKDGQIIVADCSVHFVLNKDQKPVAIEGTFRDITGRNRDREALRESEERYRAIVEAFDGLIYICSQDYRVEFMNRNFIARTGYDGTGKYCYKALHNLDSICPWCVNDRVFKGETVRWEIQSPKDKRWYYVVNCPIYHTDGTISKQAMIFDITERKQAEEELKKHRDHLEELVKMRTAELTIAKEAAEAASHAKSTFLAGMSHEFRTPLNAILGFSQILQRQGDLTEKQKDQISTIQSSGEHLLMLINDILDLARIEAQKEEVKLVEFNLPILIHEVLSTTKVKAAEKDLAFHYQECSAIPKMVRGDARKLRQVLINLLDNAVKYTERCSSVTLRVGAKSAKQGAESLEPEDNGRVVKSEERKMTDEGQRVTFEIEDTGIGIPEERIETIFEAFTKVDIQERNTEGTGLGLAISRKLVELMGGRLWVESEVGKGSTFTVELDLKVVGSFAVEAKAPERTFTGYTCGEPVRTKGERKKILIVDDNITNLAMLVSLLEPLDFDIDTAENGEEAVKKAVAVYPDLILLDLLMPVIDGDKALMQIRRDDELKTIKVIGVSAAVADRERIETFAAACDDFISKPVDTALLLDKIKAQLKIEWIDAEDREQGTKDEEGGPVKMPIRAVIEQIIQHAERGEFTKLGRILDELESEDAGYSGFCDRIRAYARRYDDEGIIEYVNRFVR